jgi:Bacterial regulatory helix-turn-helix protein, lysR family
MHASQPPPPPANSGAKSRLEMTMRRLPPLETLRVFEAAERHKSFKDAGDELGVTASAVSHRVAHWKKSSA